MTEKQESSTDKHEYQAWLASIDTDGVSLQEYRRYSSYDDNLVWRLDPGHVVNLLEEAMDEHHTMEELYTYRMLYHAHAANEWYAHRTYPVIKSRLHSGGEPPFGGGWFVVVALLPGGQVSNHYKDEFWDLFDVPEDDMAPEWDEHTPAQAADRLLAALLVKPFLNIKD